MSTERPDQPDDSNLWDRWPEVDRLLEEALDRPAPSRQAFIEGACGKDRDLLAMVQSLLKASSDEDDKAPGQHVLKAAFQERRDLPPLDGPDLSVGAQIGAYRLTGVLGVGGMGAVYLADRADGAFEREVAVKVLRRALESPDLAERFKLERQILASLAHPGIAQMLDGGVTDDGRHYLVMEYVDGVPLGQYCNERRLGVDDRIRIIMQVADAVEYAHRHMVIHRDLKPGNILVTDEGQVKLLDFGVAKLLETPGSTEGSATTRLGARFLTPEYAAPEQLLGERVSTQTDVYTLAALLYELLTSERPYANRGTDSILERVVQGAEPTAPSVVVAAKGAVAAAPPADSGLGHSPRDSHPSTLATMSTTAAELRRRLDGDLDAILLRGLRSRPEERYGSAAALRDDLERHLSGQAVTARGDAFLYKARKFTRRNRAPVAAASAVFLLATGSAVGLAVQRSAVLEERNRAEAAAALSSRDAETARQVTAFLVDLFQGSDPREQQGDTLTVRALLERGTERVDDELADQPAVRASLLEALGQVYVNLGDYNDGNLLLERAVALRRDSLPDDGQLQASLLKLGAGFSLEGLHAPAREAYEAARTTATERSDTQSVAFARLGLGSLFVRMNHLDSAETELRAGVQTLAQTGNAPEETYLNALDNLAGLVRRRGDLGRAAELYEQVLGRRRALVGGDPFDFALALNNLAIVRRMQGEFEEAAAHYAESFDTLAKLLGEGHPTSLMVSGNWARTLDESGRQDQSISVYEERVAAARYQWPEGHWRRGEALMNLGAQLMEAGRAEEAVEPLQEALDMMMLQIGPMHAWTDVYRGWLATAAALTARSGPAQQLFGMSLEGLSTYAELPQDTQVKSMLQALVRVMEENGLEAQASRYRELVELDPNS